MWLCAHSYYSLRYGVMSEEELLDEALNSGFDCAVITDINSTSAALNFIRLAEKKKVRPIVGVDFRNGVQPCFWALAKNNAGYEEINRFLSPFRDHRISQAIPQTAPAWENVIVIYPYGSSPNILRNNEYIGVRPDQIDRFLIGHKPYSSERYVALTPATFRNKRDFNTHRLLRAIDRNTLLSKLPSSQWASENDRVMSRHEIEKTYERCPRLWKQTEALLRSCSIHFEWGKNHNRQVFGKNVEADFNRLCELAQQGMRQRYPELTDEVVERVEYELKIIREKNFVSYFLINRDIIDYARSKGYFHVGRGSGANSVVAYCLGITDVDPIELDLYFERFINLYRENPPDFDIDFSWTDRDDVTRYIFEKYGEEHTALLATYVTFQFKSVLRELGKVFGLPAAEIDALQAKLRSGGSLDEIEQLVVRYSDYIQGFPSHLSVHAGGILISDQPIYHFTATFVPPKNFPVTHFDMIIAEDVGLYKFDILSQRGLGHIRDAVEIIAENRGEQVDIRNIPAFKSDPAIRELLRRGRTMGCFYVESPAMRMLLSKLETDTYIGLVAASSIIRPGVAKSGMMREYILRHRFPERRSEALPVMLEIMPETYGVMVYQEDVIKVAHYFAGLTLAEADVLRRGMSGKYRSREEFARVRDRFFINCDTKGYDPKITADVWRQTESFAGYAFSKGHSASYAVESYQSLYLKAHYPLEFMVGVINNFGGFYATEFYIHEARMSGGIIESPCVNHSNRLTVIRGKHIYLGFILVKNLETRIVRQVITERSVNGPFLSFQDFLQRIAISLEQVSILIRINAFRFTGKDKKELLWEAHWSLSKHKVTDRRNQLFPIPQKTYRLPDLNTGQVENAYDEIELLGFPLCSPFALLRDPVDNELRADDLPRFLNQNIQVYGYLVTTKVTKTTRGDRMGFGTWIDQEGYFFDTVHFPDVLRAHPFRGRAIYRISGKVTEEFGFYTLEVDEIYRESYVNAEPVE